MKKILTDFTSILHKAKKQKRNGRPPPAAGRAMALSPGNSNQKIQSPASVQPRFASPNGFATAIPHAKNENDGQSSTQYSQLEIFSKTENFFSQGVTRLSVFSFKFQPVPGFIIRRQTVPALRQAVPEFIEARLLSLSKQTGFSAFSRENWSPQKFLGILHQIAIKFLFQSGNPVISSYSQLPTGP
ncbi:hypothetical protein [uncultured Fibrobacter sp.]|uniref:hypothetical protein n=1 Tax=uncultured Fibrobacter sp. TaxID=261512 RepID=UPI0028049ACB|nr:hypothetical protein [uncultured Fibrobacter sp.]